MESGNKRNLIIFVLLSMVILATWMFFTPPASKVENLAPTDQEERAKTLPMVGLGITKTIQEALHEGKRVSIETETIKGSLTMEGFTVDSITMKHYKTTIDPNSENVTILMPSTTASAYFIQWGYHAHNDRKMPNQHDNWHLLSGSNLTPKDTIRAMWEQDGIRIERSMQVDEHYMLTITDTIHNTQAPVILTPWARIARRGLPDTEGFFINHEGPIAVSGGTLSDKSYSAIEKSKQHHYSHLNWIGFVDKYFMGAIIPHGESDGNFSFYQDIGKEKRFQADYAQAAITLGKGEKYTVVHKAFIGPKEYDILKSYETKDNIKNLTMAIDFGWFSFITKPLLLLLIALNQHMPMAVVLLLITILVKAALFPLSYKSQVSMAGLKELAPMMKSLKEKYGSDIQAYNKEIMTLYKEKKVNPLAGCLPVILQIPIFFSLYKILFISIEMRHAPFWGWIPDMSVMDNTNIFTLLGLVPWDAPGFLHLGIWPIIMGITMFLQQKLSPQAISMDAMQTRIMQWMPVIFVFMLASFPAGLVIYWSWSNILSILQQLVINAMLKRKAKKRHA